MNDKPHSLNTLLSALRDLVNAIKSGEDVNTSHWAYQRAEALVEE